MDAALGEALAGRLRATNDWTGLRTVLAGHEQLPLGPRLVQLIDRALCRAAPEPVARLLLLGSHTLEPLDACVRARLATLGVPAECRTAPYGQYLQPVLDAAAPATWGDADVAFLSLDLRDVAPRVARSFATLDAAQADDERHRVLELVSTWIEAALRSTRATLVVANFPRPVRPALGLADSRTSPCETAFYLELNLELLRRARRSPRVHVLDLERLLLRVGAERGLAPRTWFLARQPWSAELLDAVADELARCTIAARGLGRKALVVDLDDTLWGGILGEDGAEGLRTGRGDATAEAFTAFQEELLTLQRRGILLALASRNEGSDAREAFATRQRDLAVSWQDFAAAEVSWAPKAESAARIADALGIGTDALVFVDDNPVERAAMRSARPEVATPEMPLEPADRVAWLRELPWFERLELTADDARRTVQYRERAARAALQSEVRDLGAFLESLGTEVTVRAAADPDVARIHQLFAKTNQFNLTTRRYSVADVERFVASARHRLRVVEARDRFGDLGVVGVYLLEARGGDVVLDSLCVSCRALGREIEAAVMNCIKVEVAAMAGAARLTATFVPTRRNAPASGFLGRQGLRLAERAADGTETYVQDAHALAAVACRHIRLQGPGV